LKIILLNFAHPLTAEDITAINNLAKQPILDIKNIDAQIDPQGNVTVQVEDILNRAGLSSEQWQKTPIIINLPSLSYSAAIMLALLHGRMGYFPPILRMKPESGSIIPKFVVAEIINLQAVRDQARKER
jgi:hypothetical protein